MKISKTIIVMFSAGLLTTGCMPPPRNSEQNTDYNSRLSDLPVYVPETNSSEWFYEDISYVSGNTGKQASLLSNNEFMYRKLRIEVQRPKGAGIYVYLICPNTKFYNKRNLDYVEIRNQNGFTQQVRFKYYGRDTAETRYFATDKIMSFFRNNTDFTITYPCTDGNFDFCFSTNEPLVF